MNKVSKNTKGNTVKTQKGRVKHKYSRPFVMWFTGLSGAGKTTLADRVYQYLKERNMKVERLDGDILRGIFPNTGFTKEERDHHVKRAGFFASRLEQDGVAVIASLISPYKDARKFVRGLCKDFIEVYVKAPLNVCEHRDVKGLYKKARKGEIKNFTGISDPYEAPEHPEIIIETEKESIEESFAVLKNYLARYLNGGRS